MISLLLVSVFATMAAMAGPSFFSGGLRYGVTGDGEVAVLPAWEEGRCLYEGVVLVPGQVFFDGANYRVTAIADSAFWRSGVTEVQIANTVEHIGAVAFAQADALTGITLPMGLKTIGRGALSETPIKAVALPEGVTEVGDDAFAFCPYLYTVMLPSTLMWLGDRCFDGCGSLFEVYCASSFPPVIGYDTFASGSGIDVICRNQEVVDSFAVDAVWGDLETFSLWTNDDINTTIDAEPAEWHGNMVSLDLGDNHCGYRIYGEDGTEIATTAAPHYYFAMDDHDVNYTVVATNMINDCEDQSVVTVVNNAPAGIADVAQTEHPVINVIDGTIYISGDNYGKWTTVFDTYGNLYYQRPAINNVIGDLTRNRVYIVIVGDYVKKVFL